MNPKEEIYDAQAVDPLAFQTTKELVNELDKRLSEFFASLGLGFGEDAWPRGSGEILSKIRTRLTKLEGIYWDGYEYGFREGYIRGISEAERAYRQGKKDGENMYG